MRTRGESESIFWNGYVAFEQGQEDTQHFLLLLCFFQILIWLNGNFFRFLLAFLLIFFSPFLLDSKFMLTTKYLFIALLCVCNAKMYIYIIKISAEFRCTNNAFVFSSVSQIKVCLMRTGPKQIVERRREEFAVIFCMSSRYYKQAKSGLSSGSGETDLKVINLVLVINHTVVDVKIETKLNFKGFCFLLLQKHSSF